MYNILIVDDEKIERRGIKSLLKKIDLELEIQETSNGKEALEYLLENKIDILFTDIKMPFMDGIELIENVRKNNINVKIVIFTGYEEFQYAKFAAKMGVKDYILKPVDPKEFKATLFKIIEELNQTKIEENRTNKNLNLIKEQFLYSLINGTPFEEIEKKANDLIDFSSLKSYNRLLLIDFNKELLENEKIDSINILKENIEFTFEYLSVNSKQILLIFKTSTKEYQKNYNLAVKIYNIILNKFGINSYISICNEINDISKISECYKKNQLLLEKNFYNKNTHIFIEDEEKINNDKNIYLDDNIIIKQIKQDIKIKNIDSIKKQFDYLCEKYRNYESFSPTYIKFIFSNLLEEFSKNLSQINENELNDDIDRLYKSKDFFSVINIINVYIIRLEASFMNNPAMSHREIETIKQYIYDNYNKDLSVEQLAEKVFLAPSYLSSIFKKETGENLSKFIKAYRMIKAKEMLDETYEKIVNVSNAVGYQNVSYFCKSFREYFGVSPEKYRSKGESYEENN